MSSLAISCGFSRHPPLSQLEIIMVVPAAA